MRAFRPKMSAAVTLLAIYTAASHAALNEHVIKTLTLDTADQHIAPRYQALAHESEKLVHAIEASCAAPSNTGQKLAAQHAFQDAMDAWQSISHIQFGPIQVLMRNFSMQYWPDKKNLSAKHLNQLISSQDPEKLTPTSLAHASIAVKGFPALERLLFDDTALAGFRCQTAIAISQYIQGMSQGVYEEWDGFRQNGLATAAMSNDYYDEGIEPLTDIMKSLVEPFERIRDLKLLRPMDSQFEKVKPKRAESWRSERSLRNIRLNIAALEDLYLGGHSEYKLPTLLKTADAADLDTSIQQSFTKSLAMLAELPDAISPVIATPDGYQQLKAFSAELKQLQIGLNAAMKVLDIQLGFNSSDGD